MNDFFNTVGSYELVVLDFIKNNLTNPFFDAVLPFFSLICNHGEVWIAAALIMLFFPTTRKSGIAVAIALLTGLILGNFIMKPIFARMRPFDLKDVELIIKAPSDYSFPSGHTLASFEAAFAMLFTKSRFTPYAFALAGVIAFSRLYLYVHFPSDVLVSVLLAFVFALFASKLADYIIKCFYKNK